MSRRRAFTIMLLLALVGLLSALAGTLTGLLKLPGLATSSPLVMLALVVALLGALSYLVWRLQSPAELLPLRKQDRQRMLARVQRRIADQLALSLQGATLMALGLHHQPDALKLSSYTLQQPDWSAGRTLSFSSYSLQQPGLSADKAIDIVQAYEEAEGQLLILGEPGAGKSTLLLDLAHTLLARAQQDENVAMPIIFNLASWAVKRQDLNTWMVEELKRMYQISPGLGRSWVTAGKIQPLLDGWDEVDIQDREACVEMINLYRSEHGLIPTVVCSRREDYLTQRQRFTLRRAVVIQPFTQEQIDDLLLRAGRQLAGLRAALAADAELRDLAPLPLMLNLMILAYQGLPTEAITRRSLLTTRQQQVLADYVRRRLQRRGARARFKPEQTQRWLALLAEQMNGGSQSIFYLEEMQPDWLPKGWASTLYWLIVQKALNFFLLILIGALLGWVITGLIFGLFAGAFLIVIGSRILFGEVAVFESDDDIEPTEALDWPLGLSLTLLLALAGGGVLWFLSTFFLGWTNGGFLGMVTGLFAGLILWPDRRIDTSRRTKPNQGIIRSTWNAVRVGLVYGIGSGVAVALFKGVPTGILLGFVIGMIAALLKGGTAAFQHHLLRLLLWGVRYIPLRYVRFLDYAAELILLRKVGGGYIFIHRLLQDYFAVLQPRKGSPPPEWPTWSHP